MEQLGEIGQRGVRIYDLRLKRKFSCISRISRFGIRPALRDSCPSVVKRFARFGACRFSRRGSALDRQAAICVMSKPASVPHRGQIWEVTDGCDAQIQYLFSAPITFSGSCRLTAGERVCITTETTDPQPIVVSFLPVRYDELHDSLVPPDIRDTPRYKKYMLSVTTGYFYEHFRLIEDVA